MDLLIILLCICSLWYYLSRKNCVPSGFVAAVEVVFLYICEDIIKPNLKKGHIVICDRFTDSTLAYQGYARGIDKEIIKKLNNIATSGLKPDLTIYLDINPNKGIKKAKSVNKGKLTGGDRIEREGLKFHNSVRKGFLELVKKYPNRIKKVKTSEVIEKTQKEINKEIDKFFKKKKIYV